jgi:hypothetical protein
MDDVVDISEPIVDMYTDIPQPEDVTTIKQRIDAIQTAVVELHKCGEKFPGEGEEISELIAQHALALEIGFIGLRHDYALADAS